MNLRHVLGQAAKDFVTKKKVPFVFSDASLL